MASRQWENSDAAALGQPELHCASNCCRLPVRGLGCRSQPPHSNCVWSAYRFCISISKLDRQFSERDDTWPRQLPCSNLNESYIFYFDPVKFSADNEMNLQDGRLALRLFFEHD